MSPASKLIERYITGGLTNGAGTVGASHTSVSLSKWAKTSYLRKAAREGCAKMMREGWNADYPDAENFHQTLWGGNAIPSGENYSRFKLAEFDDRYEKIRKLPDGKTRNRIISEMEDLVKYYAPWIALWYQLQYYVEQPWMMGYKQHPIGHDARKYLDLGERRTGR